MPTYVPGSLAAWSRFTVVMRCEVARRPGHARRGIFTLFRRLRQRRVWRPTKQADGRFVVAPTTWSARRWDSTGNAFRWNYTLALPVDGTDYHVQFR